MRKPVELDNSDIDQIKDLKGSRAWALIRQRAEKTIEDLRNEIETCPLEAVPQKRGEIAGLRLVFQIPDILMAESKDKGGI